MRADRGRSRSHLHLQASQEFEVWEVGFRLGLQCAACAGLLEAAARAGRGLGLH